MYTLIALLVVGAASVGPPSTEASVVLSLPLDGDAEAQDYASSRLSFTEVGSPSYSSTGVVLDGAADYVRATEAQWLTNTSGSICAWVTSDDADGGGVAQSILTSGDEASSTRFFTFFISSTGFLSIGSRDGGTFNSVSGTTALVDGTTYHACVTTDGSAWKLYLDSDLETLSVTSGSNVGDFFGDVSNRDSVVVGALVRDTVASYFDGTVGQVTVWTDELAQASVTTHYNQGNPAASNKAADTEGNLVFRVPCDSDGENRDYGRDNFLMTENGTPVYASNGCTLQAAEPDYLKADVTNYREDDNIGTVCFWANPTDGVNSSIWSVADSGSGDDYMTIDLLMLTDDSVRVLTRITGTTRADIRALGAVVAGEWHHYCVGTNASGTNYVLTKDGVTLSGSVVQGSNSGDWVGDFGTGVIDNVTIGRLNRSSPTLAAEASVYDVRYYDVDLSDTERLPLYNQGQPSATHSAPDIEKGVVFKAPLTSGDISSDTVAIDYSSTQATCTATGTPPTFGATSVDLNGTTDYIGCGDVLDFTDGAGTDSPFSVCAWIRADDWTNFRAVSKIDSTGEAAWFYGSTGADTFSIVAYDANASNRTGRTSPAMTSYQNSWVHVCGTYSAATQAAADFDIYVDGVVVDNADFDAGTYVAMEDVAQDLEIGRIENGGYANGEITEVWIWDRAIIAAEVTLHKNMTDPQ